MSCGPIILMMLSLAEIAETLINLPETLSDSLIRCHI